MPLDIESAKRGEWNVVTRPAGVRVTPYTLPNQKAAKAALKAISDGIADFPWDTADKNQLRAALQVYQDTHGRSLADAVTRALAAVPAADPDGYCAGVVRNRDAVRAEHAAHEAAEEADGYTELVEFGDIAVGDEIGFRYTLTTALSGFTGLPRLDFGDYARTLIVRGTVTGPFRWMDRSGNNWSEGRTGPRFPLTEATWTDREAGASGELTAPVTVDVLRGIRRRPRTD